MIPLPKTADLSDSGSYMGISLSSIVETFFKKMILNRIQPELDQQLRPNQNGFRPDRLTTAHLIALRRLVEGVKRHNRKKKSFSTSTLRKLLTLYTEER